MAVGYREGLVRDASRTDWDGTGPRPVAWGAWYPAPVDAVEAPMRGGGPGEPWFDIGAVARDAPLDAAADRLPVVLVSHGTGGTAASMGWLARRLGQRGFAVLAVNHHGNTAVEPYRPEGFLCWWERARDLSVLLDRLATEGVLADRLDLKRVFVIGFSLGSHTALSLLGGVTDMERFRAWADETGGAFARGPREFPDLADHLPRLLAERPPLQASWQRRADDYRDRRVRSALLLAPAAPVRAFTDESLASIRAPVCILTGGSDMEAPARDGADWLAARLPGVDVGHVGPDVGHYAFLPDSTEAGRRDAPILCVDKPGVDRRAVHDAVAATAERLFTERPVPHAPAA